MKRHHFIIINILFAGLILLSLSVVYQFMTGNRPLDFITQLGAQRTQKTVTTDQCSPRKPLDTLAGVENGSLRKLAIYQHACHSFATDTVMVFLPMPASGAEAKAIAIEDAKTLKSFDKSGVRPLVIAEPASKAGTNLDFELFANGSYNDELSIYFDELKKQGITDKQMGIWNPFPEANLPYWNNNHAKFFAPAVNNYLTVAKQRFPAMKTSILLNSATYETNDFNWENGDYNSLLPFVKDIKPGMVDYAGLQGFPWASRKGGNGVIFNAAEFLNPPLLTEMADSLKTKNVWLNTGTFSAKYTLDPSLTRVISSSQRKEILMTIKDQAFFLKKKGYNVAVNIFAEDKSDQTEETNWSYWKDNEPFASPDAPVLTSFIRSLNEEKIDFWLFDR